MYIVLLVLLLLPSWFLLQSGLGNRDGTRIAAAAVLAGAVVLFFSFLDFWGELLWFESLGFSGRFWLEILARAGFEAAGALLSSLVVLLMAGRRTLVGKGAILLGLLIGGRWGYLHWGEILLFFNQVETALREPILGRAIGFYLFTLPVLNSLFSLALQVAGIGFVSHILAPMVTLAKDDGTLKVQRRDLDDGLLENVGQGRLYADAAVLAFILAGGTWLQRYHLLYSPFGTVTGAGWTDVHIRLPAYIALAILFLAAGGFLLLAASGKFRPGKKFNLTNRKAAPVILIGGTGGVILLAWTVLLIVVPALFQWLRVEPNEITYEEPYIKNNITFTRHAYKLDNVEEQIFPASGAFSPDIAEANTELLNNIRLWDRGALDAVYKQFQEIRLYYEFVGVDIDRYTVDGAYRQVMVSAREMQPANLPGQSKTFVNRRFKYTHGYGITMTPVSEFTSEGLPDLYIKDIPPQSRYPELSIRRPEIYYGELTRSHVVVNTSEGEFDYPSGEENVYIHYPGTGGVVLSSLWRKFLFGWKFDGTKLFLSGYPDRESRILFHREIRERVSAVAPFLHFDDDPYIVLDNGRLYWIIDAFTTSSLFPYSEAFSSREYIETRNGGNGTLLTSRVNRYLHGVNYIRNSVKAVVDAFNGTVHLYVYDEEDPLISTWRRVFPELFRDRSGMPGSLDAHVRYPQDMLLVQGLVYAKYHMTDPRVFYNQEDLWVRATEKYYGQVQPVQPYYIMWKRPGSEKLEFVLILPFTPKNRQVMIGWVAGMCDPDNYGRFLVYKFPKEKRILGPQQVETKIDQDRFLSGQLTLWDQRGSQVIRGNVLAIPIEETILYVEPIYLQADTAAYPELRLVILMHNDRLVYAPTFSESLAKLLDRKEESPQPAAALPAAAGLADQLRQADDALAGYLQAMGESRFEEAASALARLQDLLKNMLEKENVEAEQ